MDRSGCEKVKVLFLTQGKIVPSSRFRVQQFIPGLEALGFRCTVLPCEPSTRGEIDGWRLNAVARQFVRPFSVVGRIRQLSHVADHDVVVIQKPLLRYGFIGFERWIARRKATILDIDDALFHNAWGLEGIQTRRLGRWMTHIVAGNQYLADFFKAPEKTTIIPTVVDTERYLLREDPEGPFTIGWTGIAGNLIQLKAIVPTLERVLNLTHGRLLIVCDEAPPPWMRHLPVEFRRWTPETETTALGEFHVGLMPLSSSPYQLGKCGFKLIQYMARGIPVIASPVGVNQQIVTADVGFLASTPAEWTRALEALSNDSRMRSEMGAAGRRRVEKFYSLKAALPLWSSVLSKV